MPGKTTMTLARMFRAGMLAAPFRMGFSAFSRFSEFANHTDRLHKQFAPQPHYYLFALAVKPDLQGKGIGDQLTRWMLKRIDDEGASAYLETQKERNVGLYERLGFGVAAREAFPKLEGLSNWAMVRPSNRLMRASEDTRA
jgi:ribosomal protein S18 acetylase RimI-like enzyme